MRGEVTLDEAAEALAVSPASIRRLIVEGVLPASQSCKGAPWIIRAWRSSARRGLQRRPSDGESALARKRPPSKDEPALPLNFQ